MADIKALEAAVASDPFNLKLRRSLIRALIDAGRRDDAVAQISILRKADDHSEELQDLERKLESRAGAVRSDEVDEDEDKGEVDSERAIRPTRTPADLVSFSDIVGMNDLKRRIRIKVIQPFADPGLFARFRKKSGGGVLLYGPPGCGKTMVAKAIASEIDACFISVNASDVLNRYIGQSEANLALMFDEARSSAPAVLFFDELDGLAFARSKSDSEHSRTFLTEFLRQLDGVDTDNRGILFLAASNMPWDVDSAMKRPGRFAESIFVPPPDKEARAKMFALKLTGVPIEAADYEQLAALTPHFSGADIDGVIEYAKETVIADILEAGKERAMTMTDLREAVERAEPSTLDWLRTAKNLVKYAGGDKTYKEVGAYLKANKVL